MLKLLSERKYMKTKPRTIKKSYTGNWVSTLYRELDYLRDENAILKANNDHLLRMCFHPNSAIVCERCNTVHSKIIMCPNCGFEDNYESIK